ncbi:unnamed protein product, partial [Didymodactylos carnosus]
LDNRSGKVVQDALDKAKLDRMTIVIAHRLSTIKNTDVIIGLEKCQMVVSGTHNELTNKTGLYYELVTAQIEKEKEQNDEKDLEEKELAKQTTDNDT